MTQIEVSTTSQQAQPTLKAKPRPTPLSSHSLESIVRDVWDNEDDSLADVDISTPTITVSPVEMAPAFQPEVESTDPQMVLFNRIRKSSMDYRGQNQGKKGRARSATTSSSSAASALSAVQSLHSSPKRLMSKLSSSSSSSNSSSKPQNKGRSRAETVSGPVSPLLLKPKANKLMAKTSTSSTSSVGSRLSLKDTKFMVNVKKKIQSFSSENIQRRKKHPAGISADCVAIDSGCDLEISIVGPDMPHIAALNATEPRDSIRVTKRKDRRSDIVGNHIDIISCS